MKLSQDLDKEVTLWCRVNSTLILLGTLIIFKLVLLKMLMEVFQDLLIKFKVVNYVVQPKDVTHAKALAY